MIEGLLKTTLVAAICLSGATLCNSDRDNKRKIYLAAEEAMTSHSSSGNELEHLRRTEPIIEDPEISSLVLLNTIKVLMGYNSSLQTHFMNRCIAEFSPKDHKE